MIRAMSAEIGHSPPRRLALVTNLDPEAQSSWSGIPAGLRAGLAACDVELVPVQAWFDVLGKVTHRLGMGPAQIAANDAVAVAAGFAAGTTLRRLRRELDGVIRCGSGFELATSLPVVTLDDMTVPQAIRQPGSEYASLDPAARRRWIDRQARALRSARACCTASAWTAESAVQDLGVPAAKTRVVGFGSNFPRLEAERDWSEPRFLFVGFDWERKRGDDVLRSFAAVHARHPGARLDLVGGHPRVDLAGVTGHGPLSLASTSERDRLRDLFGAATCFVMPSRFEPFGIAYVEAGMAGVPSIGTTVGGAATAIGDGGVLVDPDDPAALTAAMMALARPEEAARLGHLASAHAAELSWPAVARRILAAFAPPAA
jgi:glycosyltransferase involved in cell wall biosynthesis